MSIKIKDNITWVGTVDWEIRKFHGEEYSTHHGSTYNSYLIQDDKTVLVDAVWGPFAKEFVHNLRKETDLQNISYIIANHAEADHSGALPELLNLIPDTPIYCTSNAVRSLTGHYHQDWNFKVVKTGDRLNIGSKELIFIEAPMLHWPDSMFCYLTGDNTLFSSDAFAQHYASEFMFNDLVDQAELYQECIKYYANILTPFSKLVEKKIEEIVGLNLPVDMICPSHGVIWRENPLQIIKKYAEWAGDYQENQITIIYDTMWNSTHRMAKAIAKGIKAADSEVSIKLFNSARADKNDVITEVFRSKAVLIGSPTVNRGLLSSVAGMLETFRGLAFKNKKAAAFGSYGWSGESVRIMLEKLKEGGFEILNDGIRALWNPDDENIESCISYGRDLAATLKQPLH